jgi:hypothetical protein
MTSAVLATNEFTVKRIDETAGQDALGEYVKSYTIAARATDGVPITFFGRPSVMSSIQRNAYGVSGTRVGWIVRSEANPKVDGRDQLTFEDKSGVTHTIRITQKSYQKSPASHVWRAIGVEDSTEV